MSAEGSHKPSSFTYSDTAATIEENKGTDLGRKPAVMVLSNLGNSPGLKFRVNAPNYAIYIYI